MPPPQSPGEASDAQGSNVATPKAYVRPKYKPSYGVGPMGKWADDDGVELEAPAMPLPGGSRRNRSPPRVAVGNKPAQMPSVLATQKFHSDDLKWALDMATPILKRASLRKMASRILDQPELLPPGETDAGEVNDGNEVSATDPTTSASAPAGEPPGPGPASD